MYRVSLRIAIAVRAWATAGVDADEVASATWALTSTTTSSVVPVGDVAANGQTVSDF
jgi:hypothetical protein